ncbi:MAG: glycosyltransferase family 2 protein [Sulfurimonas sp.]|nr:glycosyltransferase family 2 protein [Sulfurimonas sp.]
MPQMNASIVLYHNEKEQVLKAMKSFLDTSLDVKLYLVDNSANDALRALADVDRRVEYIFNNANLGYGAGHNIAMRKSIAQNAFYHLVLNPDVYFQSGVIENIFRYMEQHPEVGHLMPKVLYPDGTNQKLCKLLPTPLDLFARRFIPIQSLVDRVNNRYELGFFDYASIAEIPFLSGCFMFLRTDVLKQNCLFDENFFIYLEDADLSRRVAKISKTIFYPEVSIYHEYQRGAHKNKKLLWFFIQSTFTYFGKYGWFFDKEREILNAKALETLGFKR